jgi:pimeloyl-ACP methyl ester carboxylesterase
VIHRALAAAGVAALAVTALAVGRVARRGGDRLLRAPRALPEEAALVPTLDALGGEVVRLRSRDGLRLTARWLDADRDTGAAGSDPWVIDPREAILLLHGYSGSVAPDLVEYGPFLRRTAGVLGLDFGGHGGSDGAPTTFGFRETEDVAGALAWLGERGIRRVALFGTSMGGMTAIAATAVLGDGRLPATDVTPDAPATMDEAPRPRIVGLVGEAVAPELRVVVASRLPGPAGGFLADRILDAVARHLGDDLRSLEPIRTLPLLEDLPVFLIHGGSDPTIPLEAARRLAAAGGPGVEHRVVEGADHSRAHATDPGAYEAMVEGFLRVAFRLGRGEPTND